MNGKYMDFSTKVSELGMYSYDRVAWTYWNAFANALVERGYTEAQAMEILKSKHMRWMLDGADDKIERLAERMVADYLKDARNKTSIDAMLKEAV